MERGKVLLILNPVAGHRAARKALYPIVQMLCAKESMVTVYSTRAQGEARRIAREEAPRYDRVICCGGDGTLSEVLSGLVLSGARVPVGYVPTGTTNDLAHALGLPTELSRAIDLAVTGGSRTHDVGLINEERHFDYIASFGAFASTAYATPQRLKNWLGRAAYFLCGIRQVFELKPQALTVCADGQRVAGEFYYGSVSNTTRIAGGIIDLQGAGVAYDDGLFEVLLIRQPPTVQALRDFKRQKYDPDYFYLFRAREVRFHFSQPTEWTADGECAGRYQDVTVRCLNNAVELISRP